MVSSRDWVIGNLSSLGRSRGRDGHALRGRRSGHEVGELMPARCGSPPSSSERDGTRRSGGALVAKGEPDSATIAIGRPRGKIRFTAPGEPEELALVALVRGPGALFATFATFALGTL